MKIMTFVIVLLLNAIPLLFFRFEKKYALVSISLWLFMISTFIVWRSYHDSEIRSLDTEYWKSADENKKVNPEVSWGNEDLWKKLESERAYVIKYNMSAIHCIFWQTILTFLIQRIGYRETELKKLYKATTLVFGILTVVFLFIELMIAVIPGGYMLG